ncbi:hypothetical protein FRB98_002838 [Tulasnella sp. 332]|nr:hypothetical protein FRB98_002838 [Tulasnella sp. 332]
MVALIRFLLPLYLVLNVHAQTISTVRLNQVYWNDSRILYSSPRSGLSNVGWESYNATASPVCGLTAAQPLMCNGGAMEVCSKDDTASLIFNGTSVTVNFLSRWNGLSDIIVLVDGLQSTTVNTSKLGAEPFPNTTVPFPTNCVGSSVTKSGLLDGTHNVSVVIPASDPLFGYVQLFQSFQYTEIPVASAASTPAPPASKVNIGPVIGAIVAGLFAILSAAFLAWFFARKRRNPHSDTPPPYASNDACSEKGVEWNNSSISPYKEHLALRSSPAYFPVTREKGGPHGATELRPSSNYELHRTSTIETLEPFSPSSSVTPCDGELSHLQVIQGLLDKGVAGSEIAIVMRRMEEEVSQKAPGARLASPPPRY